METRKKFRMKGLRDSDKICYTNVGERARRPMTRRVDSGRRRDSRHFCIKRFQHIYLANLVSPFVLVYLDAHRKHVVTHRRGTEIYELTFYLIVLLSGIGKRRSHVEFVHAH